MENFLIFDLDGYGKSPIYKTTIKYKLAKEIEIVFSSVHFIAQNYGLSSAYSQPFFRIYALH